MGLLLFFLLLLLLRFLLLLLDMPKKASSLFLKLGHRQKKLKTLNREFLEFLLKTKFSTIRLTVL